MTKIPLVHVVAGLALASLLGGCSSAREHGPVRGAFSDDGYAYGGDAAQAAPGYAEEEAVPTAASDADDSGGLAGLFGNRRDAPARSAAMAPPPAPPRPPLAKPAPDAPEPAPAEASTGAEPSVVVPAARLMIYTGTATVLVPAVSEAQQKLIAYVESLGGYVQSASGDTSSNHANVTFRVPVAKFFEVKAQLPSYGQVLNDTVQAEDVTKQVFDLEIRLDNASKSRDRLVELLKQAQKMEDILQIEAEIRRLTDEIEGLKGQLRFLKDRVSFSTLTVNLYSNAPPPVTGPRRTYSRFEWINQVGPERVLNDF